MLFSFVIYHSLPLKEITSSPPARAQTDPPSFSLGDFSIGLTAGIVGVAIISCLLWFWVSRRDSRHFRRAVSVSFPSTAESRVAAAAAAYNHGDDRRVCTILTNRRGTLRDLNDTTAWLLFAAACARLESFERSADAFETALKNLGRSIVQRNENIEQRADWERKIIQDLALRFPNVAKGIDVTVLTNGHTLQPSSQMPSLTELRVRVLDNKKVAEKKSRSYFRMNVWFGGVAAAAAAGAGLSGALRAWPWIIAVLALLSAGVSTVMTTLKPAETSDAEKKVAEALDDLVADIDLFETTDHSEGVTRAANKEAQSRLRTARNRPRPTPLVAESQNPEDVLTLVEEITARIISIREILQKPRLPKADRQRAHEDMSDCISGGLALGMSVTRLSDLSGRPENEIEEQRAST
jgi:hypothetical protein